MRKRQVRGRFSVDYQFFKQSNINYILPPHHLYSVANKRSYMNNKSQFTGGDKIMMSIIQTRSNQLLFVYFVQNERTNFTILQWKFKLFAL